MANITYTSQLYASANATAAPAAPPDRVPRLLDTPDDAPAPTGWALLLPYDTPPERLPQMLSSMPRPVTSVTRDPMEALRLLAGGAVNGVLCPSIWISFGDLLVEYAGSRRWSDPGQRRPQVRQPRWRQDQDEPAPERRPQIRPDWQDPAGQDRRPEIRADRVDRSEVEPPRRRTGRVERPEWQDPARPADEPGEVDPMSRRTQRKQRPQWRGGVEAYDSHRPDRAGCGDLAELGMVVADGRAYEAWRLPGPDGGA